MNDTPLYDPSRFDAPSYSLEAEQATLGTLIYAEDTFAKVADRLSAEHFYVKIHREIYAVLEEMFVSAIRSEPVLVIEKCRERKIFAGDSQAAEFLLGIEKLSVDTASLNAYVDILEKRLLSRRIADYVNEIGTMVSSGADPDDILNEAEARLNALRDKKEMRGITHIKSAIIDRLARLGQLAADPQTFDRETMSSGYRDLDRYLHGLTPSNLIIVAGCPGMGKTTFAVNIAVNCAKRYTEKKIVVFSLEMSREELADRIICAEGFLNTDQIKTGVGIPDEFFTDTSVRITQTLSNVEFYANDSPAVTVTEMKAQLRRMNNVGLVVIDYLQLMTTGRKDGNRVLELAEITRGLKLMAKELSIPVIVASQLSRAVNARTDKRPQLSDLRESGAIEQDADSVIMLYRDDYYDAATEKPNSCECIIRKNRHGETGTLDLYFEKQFSRFLSVDYAR
ncbi:MAG: replicative DNA helicase [Oscillospiraceae bacterium]|jgi:replicative DNA helicase|nr:replicative DNA helicase [Oscillospiraceae bacterium]